LLSSGVFARFIAHPLAKRIEDGGKKREGEAE